MTVEQIKKALTNFTDNCKIIYGNEVISDHSLVSAYISEYLIPALTKDAGSRMLVVHPANEILHVVTLVYMAAKSFCSFESDDLTEEAFEVGAFYVKQNDPSRFYRFLGFNECGDGKYACFKYRMRKPYKSPEERYWEEWKEQGSAKYGSLGCLGRVVDGLRYYRGMIPVEERYRGDRYRMSRLASFYADILGVQYSLAHKFNEILAVLASVDETRDIQQNIKIRIGDDIFEFEKVFPSEHIGTSDASDEMQYSPHANVYFMSNVGGLSNYLACAGAFMPRKKMILANVGSDISAESVGSWDGVFVQGRASDCCVMSDGSGGEISCLINNGQGLSIFAPEITVADHIEKPKTRLGQMELKINNFARHTTSHEIAENDYIKVTDDWPKFGGFDFAERGSPYARAVTFYYQLRKLLNGCFYKPSAITQGLHDELGNPVLGIEDRLALLQTGINKVDGGLHGDNLRNTPQLFRSAIECIENNNPKGRLLADVISKHKGKRILVVLANHFEKVLMNPSWNVNVLALSELKRNIPETPYDIAIYLSARLAEDVSVGSASPVIAFNSIVLLYKHEVVAYASRVCDRKGKLEKIYGSGESGCQNLSHNDLKQIAAEYNHEIETYKKERQAEDAAMYHQYVIRNYSSPDGMQERLVEVTGIALLGNGLRANLSKQYSAVVYDPDKEEVYSSSVYHPIRPGCLISFLVNDEKTHDVLDMMYEVRQSSLSEEKRKEWESTNCIVRSWRKKLREYYNAKYSQGDKNVQELTEELKQVGATVVWQTVKGWLDEDCDTVCPTNEKSLQAIGRLTKDKMLTDNTKFVIEKRSVLMQRRNELRNQLREIIKVKLNPNSSAVDTMGVADKVSKLIQIHKVEDIRTGLWQMPYRLVNRVVREEET